MKLLAFALCLGLAVGCEDFAQPGEPAWNKQPCDHCHMLVSDPRFAAQLVTRSHERLFFDDPGCLAAYLHGHTDALERAWVHGDVRWIDALHAHFQAGASSPMGYGFVVSATGPLDFAAVSSAVRGTP